MQALRLLLLCVAIITLFFTGFRAFTELQTKGTIPFDVMYSLLGAVAAFLGWFFLPHDKKASGPALHDQTLIEEFHATIPFTPTIHMLRNMDFGNDFPTEAIRPLYRFVEDWDDPNKEFIDKKVEAERNVLWQAAFDLSQVFVGETVPNDDMPGYTTVYPVNQRGGPRPDHVRESARVLNKAAREFVPIYERFVRTARTRLS